MRRNLLKKGQLEIGITMMVLLVFFILLIVALVVYFQFTYTTIKESRQEILDEKFSTLVNSLTSAPEIKCSVRGIERECLDAKKLIAFREVLTNDRDKYLDEFGILGLEVEVVYPTVTSEECQVTNIDCNKFTLMGYTGDGLRYATPVSIYYPSDNIYRIGKLIIIGEVRSE